MTQEELVALYKEYQKTRAHEKGIEFYLWLQERKNNE